MPLIRPALAWFLGALILYSASTPAGPMWADSAKLTLYALHDYFPSLSPGDHPGWTLVARLWLALLPANEALRGLHLLSAVAGAAGVGLLFLVTRRRSGDPTAAHSAAAALMVAHCHWWGAAVTESYTLAIALTMLTALAAQRDARRGAAFTAGVAAGLAAATHAFSMFVTAPILIPRRPQRRLFVLAGALLGLAPMWLGFFGAPTDPLTGHHPSRVGSWLWHAAAFVDPGRALGGLARVIALVAFGLGPVALASVVARWRTRADAVGHVHRRVAVAAMATLVLLLVGYSPARLHLMVGFLAAGLLLAAPPRFTKWSLAAHLSLQVGLYTLAPAILTLAGREDLGVRQLSQRNNAWYFLCPVKTFDTGPQEYARELLAAAPPGAVVIADFNPGALLAVVQEFGAMRPDLAILPTAIDELQSELDPARALLDRAIAAANGGRPVVLADRWEPYYRIAELRRRFGVDGEPCGPGITIRLPKEPPP